MDGVAPSRVTEWLPEANGTADTDTTVGVFNSMNDPEFNSADLPGNGFSCFSVTAVLDAAEELIRENGVSLFGDQEQFRSEVAARALQRERAAAGFAVAAQDVYSIVFGNLVTVETEPDSIAADGNVTTGAIRTTPIAIDRDWFAEHFLVALRPHGVRHEVSTLLEDLFSDAARARKSIELFVSLAGDARRGIGMRDAGAVAATMNRYRDEFDAWMHDRLSIPCKTAHPFSGRVCGVAAQLPAGALGWKPPGAGACESLIVVAGDRAARDRIIGHLRGLAWKAVPARLTDGLTVARGKDGWTISAGHRIDIVGASDLGMDRRIGCPGMCVAAAVAPRVSRLLTIPRGA